MRAVALLLLCSGVLGGNMNPAKYEIANALPGHPGGGYRGKYFDIYSPAMNYKYSEVFWRMQEAVPLPPDVVARYNDSVMAVTGYEFDVVRKGPNGEDIPVPCYEHYNHHYILYIKGKYSTTELAEEGATSHPMPGRHKIPVGLSAPGRPDDIPAVTYFSEGNGNEARQSYHGYPKGYAQLIDSPTHLLPNPMMINIKDPSGDSKKRGGPLPRINNAPPGADYSGLLECPCSTRVPKVLTHYAVRSQGSCKQSAADAPTCYAAAAALGAVGAQNSTAATASLPAGCSVATDGKGAWTATFNAPPKGTASAACGQGATNSSTATGSVASLVHITASVDGTAGKATVTLRGPSGVWFGVGFGAERMGDAPWTIIVDGSGNVTERQLADHAPGTALPQTVQVVSSSVVGGMREVVLSRALQGSIFSFTPLGGSIPIINAVGSGPQLSYHRERTAATVPLYIPGVPSCVCQEGGTLGGLPFSDPCWADSDVGRQNNTICTLEGYTGGLKCCRDGNSLLDADQPIPGDSDEVYMKMRFYYEDYEPGKTHNLFRLFWMTETWANEYDVPKAPPGTPPQEAVHTISSRFKFRDMMDASLSRVNCSVRTNVNCADSRKVGPGGVNLIYAGGHCHAPACISLDLINADTGALVCHNEAVHGTGDAVYDEKGYSYIPPCVWGTAEEGLPTPPAFSLDTEMISVGRYNSTYKHTGVMSFWQMRGAYVDVFP
eukprot:TRINITY_DN4_c0_g1_i1.p1 TRINITY_DN4_c0_g1~~TRINITY_DN4_c0_g1_i1.p1  ORF type:complete len:752 (+),score=166.73 TRINITY_DN4_c0_g1_i1:99-2258(+)